MMHPIRAFTLGAMMAFALTTNAAAATWEKVAPNMEIAMRGGSTYVRYNGRFVSILRDVQVRPIAAVWRRETQDMYSLPVAGGGALVRFTDAAGVSAITFMSKSMFDEMREMFWTK